MTCRHPVLHKGMKQSSAALGKFTATWHKLWIKSLRPNHGLCNVSLPDQLDHCITKDSTTFPFTNAPCFPFNEKLEGILESKIILRGQEKHQSQTQIWQRCWNDWTVNWKQLTQARRISRQHKKEVRNIR
jgi:hypothetical protein